MIRDSGRDNNVDIYEILYFMDYWEENVVWIICNTVICVAYMDGFPFMRHSHSDIDKVLKYFN